MSTAQADQNVVGQGKESRGDETIETMGEEKDERGQLRSEKKQQHSVEEDEEEVLTNVPSLTLHSCRHYQLLLIQIKKKSAPPVANIT